MIKKISYSPKSPTPCFNIIKKNWGVIKHMRYVEKMSYQEIAHRFEMSVTTMFNGIRTIERSAINGKFLHQEKLSKIFVICIDEDVLQYYDTIIIQSNHTSKRTQQVRFF